LARRHIIEMVEGIHDENQQSVDSLDLLFGAVADATRRSMLDRLREGSLTVTELAQAYAMSLNAVSKHVKTRREPV
jgi:DNA-binding transcriptional ArsR family regulator